MRDSRLFPSLEQALVRSPDAYSHRTIAVRPGGGGLVPASVSLTVLQVMASATEHATTLAHWREHPRMSPATAGTASGERTLAGRGGTQRWGIAQADSANAIIAPSVVGAKKACRWPG
jgi:hypothetical protein